MATDVGASTLADVLRNAFGLGIERLDAQLLVLHALGKSAVDRAWLLAHERDTLLPAQEPQIAVALQLFARRAAGEPLAYLLGRHAFFNLDLQVDQRVLIPRADTEILLQWALQLSSNFPQSTVLDLGTGSGAVALAIKKSQPAAQVTALDASADALAVAQANAERLGLDVRFVLSNWFAAITGRFNLIVSNPPYIASGDPHLAALTHEPQAALVAGADGLDDLRHIISGAPAHLQPGGWLLLEHGFTQAADVQALLRASGFAQVQSRRDLAGHWRCTGGQWSAQIQRTDARPQE